MCRPIVEHSGVTVVYCKCNRFCTKSKMAIKVQEYLNRHIGRIELWRKKKGTVEWVGTFRGSITVGE